MVLQPSYLHNGNLHTWKIVLYIEKVPVYYIDNSNNNKPVIRSSLMGTPPIDTTNGSQTEVIRQGNAVFFLIQQPGAPFTDMVYRG